MHNAKGLLGRIVRDKLWRFGYRRSLCSLKLTSEDLDYQVLVEGSGCSRTAILNRPPALNALTTHMGYRLQKLYKNWEEDPNIGFVMMKGSGRAFCAGGDIVSLYHLRTRGSPDAIREFFSSLYSFIYLLGTYLKPHVAILNGVTMGGGTGVSIPGTFRVATDRTIFATPETIIGFHPDAGASFNLSHLPGRLGEYLGLTGLKLSGAEMLACGLATHYIISEEVPVMEEQLKKLLTDDPSVVESCLEKCAEVAHPEKTGVIRRIDLLEKCFSHDTVEEIIDSLEIEASRRKDTWCITTLRRLKESSPLSLKVALRSIREGRLQTLDQCLIREYRMSLQGLIGPMSGNFCEGVRARLIDKDEAPKWDPPSLEKVSEDMVDDYFCALTPTEPDLDLPVKLRESI
ncbi:ClpP/crotonase-like domain superfamily [Arabidopsis suecica]|uniref:3-hydroxyisobutyryl-CoA hydrolase n=1 Tax=Arabidopsis suecica TaxID=45249 RepID=A0A8T2FI72_ARASU|nr:ClpP/crotonase-like domain superfamily [Arabidopsis suecica]